MKNINFCDINPFVRYAQFLTITSNRQYIDIAPYDYRMFFCRSGSGTIIINGISYSMKPGCVIMWPPGCKYSILLGDNSSVLNLMGVNFDYTQNFNYLSSPIPPEKWRSYNSKKIVELINFTDCKALNHPLYIPDVPFLHNQMYNTVAEHISKKKFYHIHNSGQLKSILSLIARFAANEKSVAKSELLVDEIVQYIHSHYREEINNTVLGDIFGYHPNHLNRLVVQNTGMSIHKYLVKCRINAAIELIQASDLKTGEIAEAVGFKDSTHFLKYFKKITGKTTSDFRR
ncbi:MAG: helix-turn-helix domain-containing protein [Clostridia bacterium]|nr:helix-turn-helix domain-containing protein [Clostridia bacterium]